MGRLRDITARDRLQEASAALERGETVDWRRLATLQALDVAIAGRAALLDALDHEDEQNGKLQGILGD
jgi:hypothetical protein